MNKAWFMTSLMCDDIRREEGNKLSYMGVYGSNMLVGSFPTAMPKLCFVLSLICPAAEPLPQSVVFRLFNNDNLIGEVAVPPEALSGTAMGVTDLESKRAVFTAVLQVFPLLLAEPCQLKARAVCDGEEIKGGSWSVEQLPGGLSQAM